jgi:hypothetical protein
LKSLFITMLLVSAAAAADEPSVRHVPPAEASPGAPLRLVAVVDNGWLTKSVDVHYRALASTDAYATTPFERSSAGGWYATIPSVQRPGVEYFITVTNASGTASPVFATEVWPHPVRVEPSPDERWQEIERHRLGNRMGSLRALVEVQDFGTYQGVEDRYLRSEIDWTYRFVGILYSFTGGFGFLEGTTPSARPVMNMPGPADVYRGARYGYGGLRLRLHEFVSVDARVLMGFSQDGFVTGIGGDFVVGQVHRACVQLGGEYLADVERKVWIRLQWDTVPPLLMGATVEVTDIPSSPIAAGTTIALDATAPITHAFSLIAKVSFGSRDRFASGVGLAAGAVLDF